MSIKIALMCLFTFLCIHAHHKCTFKNDTDTAYTIMYNNNGHMRVKKVAPNDTFTIRHHGQSHYTITGKDIAQTMYFVMNNTDIELLIKNETT